MKKMRSKKNSSVSCTLSLVFLVSFVYGSAQQIVPVRLEPRHVPEVQNKYMRVINATIENGDTSLFHIHETPSAFVFLTDVEYDNQAWGQPWQKAISTKGYAWYSSFAGGASTHRVAAPAGKKLHAYDVEILSPYGFTRDSVWTPLTKDTAFISDRCAGYRIELKGDQPSYQFKGRGPMVAIHVSGDGFAVSQTGMHQEKTVANNGYAVLRPDLETAIRLTKGQQSTLILFEIR